jgi:putative ubiquitin-RnfH superfamily antitoxin RatB of RatAB toxin-antitoxin module
MKVLGVEIVYALRDEQVLVTLEVEEGTTVGEAIERSGLLARFPEIDLARGGVGIFGRAAQLHARLGDGDRVEIYRPLIADPKDARRERARRAPPRARRR